jgi:hypothetical protein
MSVQSPQPKIKYLTNKDLMEEIHRSKLSFCSYVEDKYSRYDFIVADVSQITQDRIEIERAKKLTELQAAEKKASNVRNNKEFKSSLTIDDVPPDSIVVRVMTYEHIPLNPEKEGKAKTIKDSHARCNFPPFQHYIVRDNEVICVLKSHWQGGLENGHFCKDHGKMTNNLALMFMKLVDRYGHRGNWRGYCVDTETEALTQRGWLNYQQLTIDDIILSYDIEDGNLKWSKIKSIFKDHYEGNMFRMTVTGMDALVTPGHKFVTQDGLKKTEYLLEKDRLILMGNSVKDNNFQKYPDELVELIGWVITEGNFYTRKDGTSYQRVTIYQNEGEYANRIRFCLNALNMSFSEYSRKRTKNYQIAFTLSKDASQKIISIINQKNLTMDIILSLAHHQRELLIQTMVSADGWVRGNTFSYCQKNKEHMDMFLALCTISGYQASCKKREIITKVNKLTSYIYEANVFSRQKHSVVENINFHGAKRTGKENGTLGKGKIYHPNEPTVPYDDMVWCPQTEYGTFVARRNGKIYLTGNTYLEEMKSQALLQLSLVGLQFDESRSETPNPFAYYTQTITNSFMRILNLEKKNQSIRDDMLIMAGSNPSYTRMVENEIAQKKDV